MSLRPFQIGDRVEVVAADPAAGYANGDKGVITRRDADGDLWVTFVGQSHSRLVFLREVAHAEADSRIRTGILCRWASGWIGAHWSPYNRRLCVNLIPFITLWVALPGGKVPA